MTGFEDLLPAELTSSRRPGATPMRPAGGSPPKSSGLAGAAGAGVPQNLPAAPTSAQEQPACSVDGVPDSVVDGWFREADLDGDGRVADNEARAFFLTSGLAPRDLSKIWQLVKSPEVISREGKGLSRHRFAQVLRLIALAQSGTYDLSVENTTAALHPASWAALHGAPLPPPRIGSTVQQQGAAAGGVSASSSPFAGSRGVQQHQQAGNTGPRVGAASTQQPRLQLPQPAAAGGGADLLGADLLFGSAAPDTAAAGAAAAASAAGAAAPPPAAGAGAFDDDDDLFGLKALQERAASHGASGISAADAAAAAGTAAVFAAEGSAGHGLEKRLSRSMAVSSRPSSSSNGRKRVHTSLLEAPVAFEARLPPLQPKVSAKLTFLAAGNGSLFAGPAVGGGLLQWGRPEGNMRRPLDVEGEHGRKKGKLGRLMSDMMCTNTTSGGPHQHVPTEDPDAAPSIEVAATDRGRPAACMMVDEAAALLWVADKEGWVYAYDIGGEPCMSLRPSHRAYQFQAHRVGYVTAMCRTPQGELWTGSSRGNIRVWELGEPALAGDVLEPPRCRELRKGFGERAHASPVLHLVCPADGQLVWSASGKGVLLWDAACGAFLGLLHRPSASSMAGAIGAGAGASPGSFGGSASARLGPQASQGDLLASSSMEAARYRLDGSKGLETDPITGYVLARPPSSDRARIAADQEAWAAQTDNNINELMERVSIGGSKVVQGAGKAVKLLGKLARGLGGAPAEAPKPAAAGAGVRQASSNSLAAVAMGADEDAVQPGVDASSLGSIVELLAPPDGSVWVAHKCGTVDRYSAAGRRLGSAECGASLTAAACVGQRVWLGFSDGMVSVRDAGCASLKVFQAHSAGLLSIVQTGTRTYTLAADGSIKGWSSAVPHAADLQALASLDEQARGTYRRESLRVLSVTWNVGESKPEPGSPFFRWLHEAAFNSQLVVVGLQEIEMGSSSVALAAAKDAFSQRMQEKGNTNAKFWCTGVLSALGGERHWHQVGLRQLSGMLVMVFARAHLKDSIGEVATASVACGVLGVGGNKGAVAVEFSLHRRKVAAICSHFAAHQGAVEARNANYATICRQLTFTRKAWLSDEPEGGGGGGQLSGLPGAAAAAQGTPGSSTGGVAKLKSSAATAVAALDETVMGAGGDVDSDAESSVGGGSSLDTAATATSLAAAAAAPAAGAEAGGEGMRGADMLLWVGDFNYRIDGSYEAVKEHAIRNELGVLLEMDQCRREMAAGRVFRGLREGCSSQPPLTFRPTYKFDKAAANPFAYDTSEKRRIPAWCDRILYRGSVPFPTPEPEEGEVVGVVDDEIDVAVAALEYNCWADVTDSDHKPVYAVLEASLPVTDQAKKRAVCSQLLKDCAAAAAASVEGEDDGLGSAPTSPSMEAAGGALVPRPRCTLLPDHVKLHPTTLANQMVLLRNEGRHPLLFSISCEGPPGASSGGPAGWGRSLTDDDAAAAAAHQLLEVRPVRGVVPSGGDCPITVHLAGDEWSLRGVQHPPELRYSVRVGGEYSAGGEVTEDSTLQLGFTATCLTHL